MEAIAKIQKIETFLGVAGLHIFEKFIFSLEVFHKKIDLNFARKMSLTASENDDTIFFAFFLGK